MKSICNIMSQQNYKKPQNQQLCVMIWCNHREIFKLWYLYWVSWLVQHECFCKCPFVFLFLSKNKKRTSIHHKANMPHRKVSVTQHHVVGTRTEKKKDAVYILLVNLTNFTKYFIYLIPFAKMVKFCKQLSFFCT